VKDFGTLLMKTSSRVVTSLSRSLLISLVAIFAIVGCVVPGEYPVGTGIGLIAPSYDTAKVRIVQKRVEGKACAPMDLQAAAAGNYGPAVSRALEKAPGTNVLVNVEFHIEVKVFEFCRRVVGDAGVLE